MPSRWRELNLDRRSSLLIPVELAKDGLRLSLFTTLTTLGTAEDITLSELCIEHYFPADAETEAVVRAWLASS